MGVAMELKMMAGSEMEMAGVTGKLKETAGSEVETVVGMEGGVDTKVGTDSKLTVDMSRNIGGVPGAKASVGSTMVSAVADVGVETGSMAAGTDTGDDAVAVARVEVCMIAERIPSACVVASEFSALANVRLGITGMEMEWVGVYGYRNGSVCMCGSKRVLSAGKCAAWNFQDRKGDRGGGGVFSSGCAFGHKSGNGYGGGGCECEYANVGSFRGGVRGMENWSMCSFQC